MVLSYTIRDNFLKPLINKQTEGIEQAGNLVVVKPPILLVIALYYDAISYFSPINMPLATHRHLQPYQGRTVQNFQRL